MCESEYVQRVTFDSYLYKKVRPSVITGLCHSNNEWEHMPSKIHSDPEIWLLALDMCCFDSSVIAGARYKSGGGHQAAVWNDGITCSRPGHGPTWCSVLEPSRIPQTPVGVRNRCVYTQDATIIVWMESSIMFAVYSVYHLCLFHTQILGEFP